MDELAAALTQSEHKDKRFAPARAELRSHSAVKARMKAPICVRSAVMFGTVSGHFL